MIRTIWPRILVSAWSFTGRAGQGRGHAAQAKAVIFMSATSSYSQKKKVSDQFQIPEARRKHQNQGNLAADDGRKGQEEGMRPGRRTRLHRHRVIRSKFCRFEGNTKDMKNRRCRRLARTRRAMAMVRADQRMDKCELPKMPLIT